MKKLFFVLLLLTVLAGCGFNAPAENETPAELTTHTHRVCSTGMEQEFLLYSNGNTVIGTELENLDRTFYQIDFSKSLPAYTELFALHDLVGCSLVELDGENGIWVAYTFDETCYLSRYDFSGTPLLTLDFGDSDIVHAVLSMAWDEDYYYFLMDISRNTTGSGSPYYIYGYDKTGKKAFEQPLFQISSDTQGYLDAEDEWMEDMEGNGVDNFLHGSTDSFKLTRLQDGSAALLIYREAPIGQETYVIVCPMETDPLSITPVFSFQADLYESFEPLAVPFVSTNPNYDLYFMTPSGLTGIDLMQGEQSIILHWEDIDYPINNRRENAVSLPDGTLVLQNYDFNSKFHQYHFLTPNN